MEGQRPVWAADGERWLFAAGAIVIAAVVVADLVAGSDVSLVSYLVLGPLLAAAGARPKAVAFLAVVALAVAIPLGEANDILFGLRHFISLGLIIAGDVIAIALAVALRDLRASRAREAFARQRLALLDRSSNLIAAPLNAATRLEELARLTIPDIGALCIVDLLDDSGAIAGAIVSATDEELARAVRELRLKEPLDPASDRPAAVALRTGEPQLVKNIDDAATAYAAGAAIGRRISGGSAVVAPLIARGRELGVMSVLRFDPQPQFDEGDLSLVSDLAARAAVAADNGRLFDELQATEKQLEAILSVVAEAVTVQDRNGRLIYVNEAARELLGARTTAEILDQPPGAIADRYEMFDEHGNPLDSEALPGRVALRGEDPEPVNVRWIDAKSGDERWTRVKSAAVRDDEGRPVLAVNIIEDVTDERRQAERAELLAETSNLLASAAEYETGLVGIAEALVPRRGDACTIELIDERDRLHCVAAVPPDTPTVVEASDAVARARAAVAGEGTVMVAPLIAGERAVGVLTLTLSDGARRFGTSDLLLADELGRRLGLGVEHARVHRERTHVAATLQRSLLPPRLPAVAGLSIAARFRAAGSGNQVGGDFYDVFEVDGGWVVVIGDVTGKGADAAAITSLARYTMRTAARYEASPGRILDRLNDALLREAGERRRLCTAICLRIDDRDGRHPIPLTIACAGHPPPYLLRGDEIAAVSAPGPLLGAFDNASWPTAAVELHDGDSLVLYTDGVTDASGGGAERFGDQRLRDTLRGTANGDANGLATAVDAALGEFQEGPQRDDLALLVLTAGATRAHDAGGLAESLRRHSG